MSDTDRVRVTTVVGVDPASAFEVFTQEVDLWWRRDRRFRAPGDRSLAFEPGPGGRLVAYQESGEVFEITGDLTMHGVTKELLKLVRASKVLHEMGRARAQSAKYSDGADHREHDTEAIYFEVDATTAFIQDRNFQIFVF